MAIKGGADFQPKSEVDLLNEKIRRYRERTGIDQQDQKYLNRVMELHGYFPELHGRLKSQEAKNITEVVAFIAIENKRARRIDPWQKGVVVTTTSDKKYKRNSREGDPTPKQSQGFPMCTDSRYLQERDTAYGRDISAYRRLTKKLVENLPREKYLEALKILGKLREAAPYELIEKCIINLAEEGTLDDRATCLFPFRYLQADPSRIQAVLSRIRMAEERIRAAQVKRELESIENSEFKKAFEASQEKLAVFQKEFPTELEQLNALRRLHALYPERFFGLDPMSRLGIRIGVLLWCEIFNAGAGVLEELAQNAEPARGQPQPAGDHRSWGILERGKIAC